MSAENQIFLHTSRHDSENGIYNPPYLRVGSLKAYRIPIGNNEDNNNYCTLYDNVSKQVLSHLIL